MSWITPLLKTLYLTPEVARPARKSLNCFSPLAARAPREKKIKKFKVRPLAELDIEKTSLLSRWISWIWVLDFSTKKWNPNFKKQSWLLTSPLFNNKSMVLKLTRSCRPVPKQSFSPTATLLGTQIPGYNGELAEEFVLKLTCVDHIFSCNNILTCTRGQGNAL